LRRKQRLHFEQRAQPSWLGFLLDDAAAGFDAIAETSQISDKASSQKRFTQGDLAHILARRRLR